MDKVPRGAGFLSAIYLPHIEELLSVMPLSTISRKRKWERVTRYNPLTDKLLQKRNEPCACGSGKKFKKCCMKNKKKV